MTDENLEATAPSRLQSDSIEPNAPSPETPKEPTGKPIKSGRGRIVWLGILFLLLAAVISGLFGYQRGIAMRVAEEDSQKAMLTTYQFQLAELDIQNGRLDAARQRLEYVISLDPGFPGAQEKLTDVLLYAALTLTPAPTATPTLTPTPDLRGVEEMFQQAQQHMVAKEWASALASLNALRDHDLTYRTVEVDGMYYITLRFLGVQKILYEGNLEGGMYDLSLAERFAPLDVEADSYRTWARYYLSGASFWGANWERVIAYFKDIYAYVPNLRDASGVTATERYRLALFGYGQQLAGQGKHCDAQSQLQASLDIAYDEIVKNALDTETEKCNKSRATPIPPQPTATPTEGGGETPQPTEEPTPEPTPTP
ncbi:MAG TPA: hypothetical protein PLS77_09160 [Anaerolineaceae bacterium]|jgi:tetratricopeptide (TPR) repeat protein|nr:hypothetical protein [Anaerolineaceae bacterium]HPA32880.1 hypothetical protein [Anaerolineaceae bacterium]HQF46631.1 hypothetical protein [Anaerolineaceae bacterium]HQH35862.1 hypothetical protein [Anaerolineaceae bacterium]HQJ04481.1 hypothetical protein [Anaerolineaceae bacterium]